MGSGVTCLVSFLFLMTGLRAQATVPDNVVWTDPSRPIWLGERNVNITCNFRGSPYAVYWLKGAAPTSASEVVTWYGDSVTYGGDIDSAAFKINGDYSLRLVSPTEADTGRYICRVSNYNGFLIYNHTDVKVLDPENVVAFTTPKVMAWKGSDVFLPCDFRGTAERVIWNKVSGTGEYQLLETVLTYADDSYSVGGDRRFSWGSDFSLHLQKIELPDESNYTCQVWKTDGIELNNHTMLTVNARPDKPYVLIEQCGSYTTERQCTRNITDDTQTFRLVCSVNGAKPRIDGLSWSETATGRIINDTSLYHEEREDGTHNSRLVMDINLSAVSRGTAFTCTANGSAVYETWNQTVVIAIVPAEEELPPPSGLSSGGKAAVAVFIIFLLIFCFVGAFIFLYVGHKSTLERVFPERFLGLFVCLDRFTEASGHNEESMTRIGAESTPLDPLIAKLEERREKIRTYVPGKVSSFYISENTTFNIGLYGVMTSGKSALTNSFNFAFTGEYKSIAAESSAQTEGGSTMYKNTVPLTKHVHFIDTRGMQDYDEKEINNLMKDILGKRGQDSRTKTKIGKQTHCPVFVLKSSDKSSLSEGVTFLKSFSDTVYTNYGRYPHVVITHKHALVLGGERVKVHDITAVNKTEQNPNETEKSDDTQKEMEQGNLTKKEDVNNEEIPGVQVEVNENETPDEHQAMLDDENGTSGKAEKRKWFKNHHHKSGKDKKDKQVKQIIVDKTASAETEGPADSAQPAPINQPIKSTENENVNCTQVERNEHEVKPIEEGQKTNLEQQNNTKKLQDPEETDTRGKHERDEMNLGAHRDAEGKENAETDKKSKKNKKQNKRDKKNEKVKKKDIEKRKLDPNFVDTNKEENNKDVTDQANGNEEEVKPNINTIESNAGTSGEDTQGGVHIANKPFIQENKMEQQNKGVAQDENQPILMADKGHVDNVTKMKKGVSNIFKRNKSETKGNVEDKNKQLEIYPVDNSKEGENKEIIPGSETCLPEGNQEEVIQGDKYEPFDMNQGKNREDKKEEEESARKQSTDESKLEQQKEGNYKKTEEGAEKSNKGRGPRHFLRGKKENKDKYKKPESKEEGNQESDEASVKEQTENSMEKSAKQEDKPIHEQAGHSGHTDPGHSSEGKQALTSVHPTSNKEQDINQKDDQVDLWRKIIQQHTKIPRQNIHAFENYTEENHEEDREKSIELLDFVWNCIDTAERNVHFREEREEEKKNEGRIVKFKRFFTNNK